MTRWRSMHRCRRPVRDKGPQQPEVHRQRDEVLLGAVVDVALHASPALLRCQHESLPRRAQVTRPQLGLGHRRVQRVAQDRRLQDGRDVPADVREERAVPGGHAGAGGHRDGKVTQRVSRATASGRWPPRYRTW